MAVIQRAERIPVVKILERSDWEFGRLKIEAPIWTNIPLRAPVTRPTRAILKLDWIRDSSGRMRVENSISKTSNTSTTALSKYHKTKFVNDSAQLGSIKAAGRQELAPIAMRKGSG